MKEYSCDYRLYTRKICIIRGKLKNFKVQLLRSNVLFLCRHEDTSNHPPITTKNTPAGINKRLSSLSSDKASFDKAAPPYQKALDEGGYQYTLHYEPTTTAKRKNRQRSNILWYIYNSYIYFYTHLYFICRAFSTWAIRLGGMGNPPPRYRRKINCIVLYCKKCLPCAPLYIVYFDSGLLLRSVKLKWIYFSSNYSHLEKVFTQFQLRPDIKTGSYLSALLTLTNLDDLVRCLVIWVWPVDLPSGSRFH